MNTTAILNNSVRAFSRHTRLSSQASVSSQLSPNVRHHQHQQAVRRYRTHASTESASRESRCLASSQRRHDRSVATNSTWMHSLSSSRGFHSSAVSRHMGIDRPAPRTGIKVNFQDSKGNLLKTVEANEGDDILAIAHEYDIDLEGACEGSVACSTCHVILPPEYYDLLPEPEDDENDMLDMAFGLTDTSRLGCQVKLTKEMDGMDVRLPAATRNMFVDGKKASH